MSGKKAAARRGHGRPKDLRVVRTFEMDAESKMRQKKKNLSREVAGGGGAEGSTAGVLVRRGGARIRRRELTVGLVVATAVAGVVAGALLTKLLLRARADRRWDQQVDRFREQGAM